MYSVESKFKLNFKLISVSVHGCLVNFHSFESWLEEIAEGGSARGIY